MNTTSDENLFRRQAIKALSERRPGPAICLMPRPWMWLTGVTTLIFVSIVLIICNAEYSRKESVRGWLVSKQGVARVTSRTPAIVRDVVHQPGDPVKEGDALIYLSSDSVLASGSSENEEVLHQLRQEIVEIDSQVELSRQQQGLERQALTEQLEDFDSEVVALASRLDTQRQIMDLTRDKLQRLQVAANDGAVSQWDLIRQQEELGAMEQGSSRLAQDIARQHREREQLKSDRERLPVRGETQRSVLRARRLQLAQQVSAHESRRLSVLESPITGTVASVEIHAGSSVPVQRLLMTILPANAELVAEVFVPSRAAGFVKTGQRVRIAYDAFPQQKFGMFEGRIDRVSDVVLLPGEIPQTFSIREATYKVQIAITDAPVTTSIGSSRLRPGMLLAADIVLEKRNLIDWLLEPLRARRTTAG